MGKLLYRGETTPDTTSSVETESEDGALNRRDFLKVAGAGVAASATLFASPSVVLAKSQPYIDFTEHGADHFSRGNKKGVVLRNGTLQLSNPERSGGRYVGWLTSKPVGTSVAYDTLIPSWEATTPPGTRLEMLVRVRYYGRWSKWMNVGDYSAIEQSRSASPAYRNWEVKVDTIQSRHRERAGAYQYHLRLISDRKNRTPVVRRVTTVASQSSNHGKFINSGYLRRAWGKSLNLPERSQYDYDRGAAWCSPTSLSMVLAYWGNRTNRQGLNRSVPATARGVYDARAGICGNWPFNTAYAAHLGLEARVTRFNSLQQVERWIDKGIPVIASVAWNNSYRDRRLSNASIYRATYGHLMVIVGFTKNGDVIVNDPAASPRSTVRRVYNRSQFRRAWLDSDRWRGGRSDGVVYLVHPRNWKTPTSWASNGSW